LFLTQKQFYIKTNNIIKQNIIFLKNVKVKKTPKTTTISRTKKIKPKTVITNIDRKNQLNNNEIINKKLQNPLEIINNKTGEVKIIQSFNVINTFHKKLLDSRFIALVLGEEFNQDGLFITLTTTPQNNLEFEILELEEQSKKIIKLLERNKIKHIKVYELTEDLIPHIHIYTENQVLLNKFHKILQKEKYHYQIDLIEKQDTPIILNYMTKFVNEKNKTTLFNFEEILKSLKLKIFKSSQSKIFTKAQRSPLYSAYQIHKEYTKNVFSHVSKDFMNFVFKYVKNPTTSHNKQLNEDTPHFIIDGIKVIHSTGLRVFSKYSRFDKNEKRSIEKTHKQIIDYSKMLLNNIIITIIEIKNTINYIYNYITTAPKYRIIIIKPPP